MDFRILTECIKRNTTIEKIMAKYPAAMIKAYIKSQANVVCRNRIQGNGQCQEDFLTLVKEYCNSRAESSVTEDVMTALRQGVLQTADHHGGMYSPQSFQGDLLYWELLKELGVDVHYLPICTLGALPMGNAVYSQGLMSFEKSEGPTYIPLFSKKTKSHIVSYVSGFEKEQIQRAITLSAERIKDKRQRDVVSEILSKVYLSDDILKLPRYGDQIVEIGRRLSSIVFQSKDMPEIFYIEMEVIMNRLLVIDLDREQSLIKQILTDKNILQEFNREHLEKNVPLSRLLFFGIDDKKRKFPMVLHEDFVLRGTALGGKYVEYSAKPGELLKLIEEERIVLTGYAMAVMLVWDRGINWVGGIFQAEYLPEWQRRTMNCLERAGKYDWVRKIKSPDCSGYISGPIYLLAETEDHAACHAGPLEIFRQGGLNRKKFEKYLMTTMGASHIMGGFEFYHDLVPEKNRIDGWYKEVAKKLQEKYNDNII